MAFGSKPECTWTARGLFLRRELKRRARSGYGRSSRGLAEPNTKAFLRFSPISPTVPNIIVVVRMRHEKGSTLGRNRCLCRQGGICSSRGSAQVFRLDRRHSHPVPAKFTSLEASTKHPFACRSACVPPMFPSTSSLCTHVHAMIERPASDVLLRSVALRKIENPEPLDPGFLSLRSN